jgi:uncharacterized membrane protein
MRFSWRSEWLHWLLLAGMFALAAAAWGTAPDRIPVHWGLTGHVDRYGGRFEGLLELPLVTLVLYLLLLFLPRLDPGRANYLAFAPVYTTLRLLATVVMALIYGLVHLWIRGAHVRMEIWIPVVLGGMFVVVGNLLGKVRPNWFVGIRTPWALSSKTSWAGTHRAGGRVFMAMGVMLMVCAVVRTAWAMYVTIGASVAGLVGVVVYSYVLWRRDPDKTPPAGTLPADDGS